VSYHAELVGEEGVDLGQQVEQRSVGHRQGEGSLIRKILEPSLGFLIGERRGEEGVGRMNGQWIGLGIGGFPASPILLAPDGGGRRRQVHKPEKEEPARAPV
jgi:hypothetical protein